MNKLEAHALLDRQKRGLPCLPSEVSEALWVCGDTRGDSLVFSEGMDRQIQQESQADWQSQGNNMVAHSSRFYGSEAWFALRTGLKTENE